MYMWRPRLTTKVFHAKKYRRNSFETWPDFCVPQGRRKNRNRQRFLLLSLHLLPVYTSPTSITTHHTYLIQSGVVISSNRYRKQATELRRAGFTRPVYLTYWWAGAYHKTIKPPVFCSQATDIVPARLNIEIRLDLIWAPYIGRGAIYRGPFT